MCSIRYTYFSDMLYISLDFQTHTLYVIKSWSTIRHLLSVILEKSEVVQAAEVFVPDDRYQVTYGTPIVSDRESISQAVQQYASHVRQMMSQVSIFSIFKQTYRVESGRQNKCGRCGTFLEIFFF